MSTSRSTCLTWYEQYAFCIWDGGFLPSIAEWNYAAVGGDEHRFLPWSIPPASSIADGSYAVFCGSDCGPRAVGSKAPKGNGRYGQADLGGSLSEATLDLDYRSPGLCDDCLQLYPDVVDHFAGASPRVEGDTFDRGDDPAFPATLSDFRLDRFEITVGRFRTFVAAWNAGFRPEPGAGKHAHLNGGLGLLQADDGYEAGWDAIWNANLATTPEDWDDALGSCDPTYYDEWTSVPGANETRPIQCLTFYEAYAFCVWDGGFLPSEAEWSFAASGGPEQRTYPWGDAIPDDTYAVFGPTGLQSLHVGSLSPRGDSLFMQADLGGNAVEWVLDFWHPQYETSSCDDCVDATTTALRVARGGGLGSPEEMLRNSVRGFGQQATRAGGARCARPPE